MSTFQIQGNSGQVAEVEPYHRALRVVARPIDVGSLGAYSWGGASGVMAAGLAAAAPIWSMRYGAANLALVRRILFTAGDITALAAGTARFDLFIARSFSASDTGGTGSTLTGNNQKLRASHASTGMSDIRISATAALAAGTRTLDGTPITVSNCWAAATAGVPLIPMTTTGPGLPLQQANNVVEHKLWNLHLFEARAGEYPIVLAQNEGLVIQATVPGTGTWTFGVKVKWTEVASY